MPTFSLNKQLAVITALFAIFAALVLFQIYYSHAAQQERMSKLIASHKIVNDYISLEEGESTLIDRIKLIADGVKPASEEDFQTLSNQASDWFQKLQLWRQSLEVWQHLVGISSESPIFSPEFLELKQRQAAAYAKALALCKEGKLKDAGYLVNIEKNYRPSVHRSISAILDGIKLQIDNDNAANRRFYAGSAAALLVALLALVIGSVGVLKTLSANLKSLEIAASRIAKGDFTSSIPKIKSPVELAGLAGAFGGMQEAVKARDAKIREDNEEIHKLNESLERKVLERNRTIMQQNLALTRKNEELEQVLYAASHDLRTPLIGIQGFSEELKLSCAELTKSLKESGGKLDQTKVESMISEDIEPALHHIINGSKRMEILLEGLLRISRMGRESLQLQELDMNELVKNVAAGFDYQLHEFDATIAIGKLDKCYADSSQFEQVFTNLIGNAIKYRSPERKLEIHVGSEQDAESVRYFVRDNGIGIAKEHVDRVFHAFFRVDPDRVEGDGVGLAIVNRALDLHGGRTWVESELGKGSAFYIEIPKVDIQTTKA